MRTNRPSFKKPKTTQAYDSPEELFGKLPNRDKTHGYLRAPQVDALRLYMDNQMQSDIALELPTGTGKTTVGLLIAEWHRRRSGKKVACLSLTNQLAKQVLMEAQKLGIDCADLRGTRETRKPAEVGRYQAAQAVGVTTYSNLFNVNPVIHDPDLLIFDDAHGGEQFVSGMWTVRIVADEHSDLHIDCLSILRPALSDTQYRVITNELNYGSVELVAMQGHPEVLVQLTDILDKVNDASIHFPWSLIRNNFHSCIVLVSLRSIVIRPIVPPTYTHKPFSEAKQRLYMSATLGGEGDIQRSYGIQSITPIRAQHPQWGKRYIFTPGLYLDDTDTEQLIADIWKGLKTRRALLLAPSFNIGERTFSKLASKIGPPPTKLRASDIEDSLNPFTEANNTILSLAGRYDGVDLPGDDCRLLIMAESPGAIGALEQHQKEHWKLGPLLRSRERTRLVQGMGRCTRDATDFAVIFLLGQSLVNSVTTPLVVQGLPGEIQRELKWGIAQGEVVQEDENALVQMILGLLNDPEYRKEANENLEEIDIPATASNLKSYDEKAKKEVQFSHALWEENYTKAYEIAREVVDEISGPELGGYRAWWFYLGSMAAHLLKDAPESEIDCLKRARAIGVNTGFLDHLLRKRTREGMTEVVGDEIDVQAEAIWNQLEEWGWHGPMFGSSCKKMMEGLAALSESIKYHMGLEYLGKCLGAEPIRSTEDAAPDVVWILPGKCFAFEAKSDKKPGSPLFKKEIQQAKGHPEWLVAKRPELSEVSILPVVVSPTRLLDSLAEPHAIGLYYISTDDIAKFADIVSGGLKEIRAQFAGKEYGAVFEEFKVQIKRLGLDLESISARLSQRLLEKR